MTIKTSSDRHGDDFGRIVICSEKEAWQWLEKAVFHPEQIPEKIGLRFDQWPTFHMKIEGKDWHGSVPSRIMSPLLDVQRDLHRAYAQARHGESRTIRLTQAERDNLEIVLKVQQGSSEYDADLWLQLTELAGQMVEKMESVHILYAVIVLALTWGGRSCVKAWLVHRMEEKRLDHALAMSKEENERLKIMAEAVRKSPLAAAIQQDFEATQNRLFKAVKPNDAIYVGDTPLPGSDVAEIVHAEREYAKEQTITGQFRILANDTEQSAGFRIKIARLSDGLTLRADVPLELPASQQKLIRDAEWSKGAQVVRMTIQVDVLREQISDAVVISVSRLEKISS